QRTQFASAAETGFLSPSSNSGNWSNGSNAYSADGSVASDDDGDTHSYWGFSFTGPNQIPSGATIQGIQVNLRARSTDSSGCAIGVRISRNSGSDWSSQQSLSLSGSLQTLTAGGSSSLWGMNSWSNSHFTSSGFRVQVQDLDPGGSF